MDTSIFGPDGNLWVLNSRSIRDQPEGILTTYDVFTPDGDFIKTVSARCKGDPTDDLLIWTPSGDAVLITGFQSAGAAMQGQGALGGGEEEEEAKPMEVVYLRHVDA